MFKWKENLSCNIEEIDGQHQNLLKLGQELYDLLKLGNDVDKYDDIMKVLSKLADYTVYHFGYEEELLAKHRYPLLESHKKQHQSFVTKIDETLKQDIDSKQSSITMEMIMFIADWIEKHILGSDHQYASFLNQKGIH
ncbi:MAG: hemerythrin family protein [Epulopiscium sp.]|nr:hemerythrin family protein [Candidatus Epulonipiscium sp.]